MNKNTIQLVDIILFFYFIALMDKYVNKYLEG